MAHTDMIEERDSPDRQGTQFTKDWTQGSIFWNLLSLSWPIAISSVLNMLGPTIDLIWVGRLGTASIAGVGVAGMVVYVVNSTRMGLNTGTSAMIARFVGAGDAEGANHVARQGFAISIAFSVVVALIGVFLAEPILKWMGVEADVVAEGSAYMRILLVGSLVMSFRMMAEGIMQASGDAVTPMRISVGYRILHVALCPFLVLGWWIFPRLGVRGAALTNIFSQSLGLALGLWVLFSGRTRLRLSLRNFRLDGSTIWRIVKIGIPASVMTTQDSTSYFVMTWLMIPFGTVAVAAHSLILRIDVMLFMLCMGLGRAAGVLVGQNLGAHQPGRAERSGWLATALAQGVVIVFSVPMLLWPESVIRIFNSEPDMVAVASTYLRIAVVGFLLIGYLAVLMQCLSGAGDTVPLMVIGLVMSWLVQLPLAFLLPRVTDLGVYGVRWAMVIGLATGSATSIVYFRLGRWKRKRV